MPLLRLAKFLSNYDHFVPPKNIQIKTSHIGEQDLVLMIVQITALTFYIS